MTRFYMLVVLGWLLAAAITTAGIARANPLDDYTIVNAPIVCAILDSHPTVAGIEGIGGALVEKGLTPEDAGQVVARSIVGWCPEHADTLQTFIAKWTQAQPISGSIGGRII